MLLISFCFPLRFAFLTSTQALVARNVTKRTQTYAKTIANGETFQAQARAMLLRVSLTQNNMTVKPEKTISDKGARMAGLAGMAGMMGMMHGGNPGMQGRRN